MALTGAPLLALATLFSAACVVAALSAWDRGRPNGRLRWPARFALIVGCQLTALLALAIAVNDIFGFYASWTDLLGGQQPLMPAAVHAGRADRTFAAELATNWVRGRGTVVPVEIPGVRSGVRTEPGYAYLPPQYGDPQYAHRSFPVVELLDGYPGGPQSWLQSLMIAQNLDREIDAGRTVPMIAIMPTQTVDPPRDTECVNVARGPQVETYLTYDVRAAVLREFRASPERRAWAVMGYSTGGFCATNILLHDGSMFGSAVSMAGYYTAIRDPTTGDLYGHNRWLRLFNSPTWYGAHARTPDADLLIVASREDPGILRQVTGFLAHLQPELNVARLILRHGGHNPAVWRAEMPACLDWLGHQLVAPLSAGATVIDNPNVLPRLYDWKHHRPIPAVPSPTATPVRRLVAAHPTPHHKTGR